MTRLTHLFAYLNSDGSSWQYSNGIKKHQLYSIEITDALKKARREWKNKKQK